MAEPAVEQHPFGDGGLARVDVGDHADVAKVVDVDGHEAERSRKKGESLTVSHGFHVISSRIIDEVRFQHNNTLEVGQGMGCRASVRMQECPDICSPPQLGRLSRHNNLPALCKIDTCDALT